MKRKYTCHKIAINKQGYDCQGKYYGIDKPVYCFDYAVKYGGHIFGRCIYVRAINRKEACKLSANAMTIAEYQAICNGVAY